ncbi:MAG: hypothetical protein ACRD4B_00325, partial [Acidobacteriota bacterium]
FFARRAVLQMPFDNHRFEAASQKPDTPEYLYGKIVDFTVRHPEDDGGLTVFPEGKPGLPYTSDLSFDGLTLYGLYFATRIMPVTGDTHSVELAHDPSAETIVAEVEKQRNDNTFFETDRIRLKIGYDGNLDVAIETYARPLPPIIAEDIINGLTADVQER